MVETAAGDVTISIAGGPCVVVPWAKGMTVQSALQRAYDAIGGVPAFTYATQFFGSELGHMVCMINQTYNTLQLESEPYFYWELLINHVSASQGVEQTRLAPGDEVSFRFTRFDPVAYKTRAVTAPGDA